MLGSSDCGTGCSTVIHSRDAGRHWGSAGTVPAPIAEAGGHGVSSLQMSPLGMGFAFGPDLYSTDDGGRTWNRAELPGEGQQVLALAVSGHKVQIAVSGCGIATPDYECDQPTTLWRSPTWPMVFGLDPLWTQADLQLPANYNVQLDAKGRTAYLSMRRHYPRPDLLYATTNGWSWSQRPSPCEKSQALNRTLVDVAPISRDRVGVLCLSDAGWSKSTKTVFRSGDTARTYEPAGTAPRRGLRAHLAAAPSGALLITSTAIGSLMYLNDGGQSWSSVFERPGPGFNDPVFTTSSDGYVIHSPASRAGGPGEVLVTHDGGKTWAAL